MFSKCLPKLGVSAGVVCSGRVGAGDYTTTVLAGSAKRGGANVCLLGWLRRVYFAVQQQQYS